MLRWGFALRLRSEVLRLPLGADDFGVGLVGSRGVAGVDDE